MRSNPIVIPPLQQNDDNNPFAIAHGSNPEERSAFDEVMDTFADLEEFCADTPTFTMHLINLHGNLHVKDVSGVIGALKYPWDRLRKIFSDFSNKAAIRKPDALNASDARQSAFVILCQYVLYAYEDHYYHFVKTFYNNRSQGVHSQGAKVSTGARVDFPNTLSAKVLTSLSDSMAKANLSTSPSTSHIFSTPKSKSRKEKNSKHSAATTYIPAFAQMDSYSVLEEAVDNSIGSQRSLDELSSLHSEDPMNSLISRCVDEVTLTCFRDSLQATKKPTNPLDVSSWIAQLQEHASSLNHSLEFAITSSTMEEWPPRYPPKEEWLFKIFVRNLSDSMKSDVTTTWVKTAHSKWLVACVPVLREFFLGVQNNLEVNNRPKSPVSSSSSSSENKSDLMQKLLFSLDQVQGSLSHRKKSSDAAPRSKSRKAKYNATNDHALSSTTLHRKSTLPPREESDDSDQWRTEVFGHADTLSSTTLHQKSALPPREECDDSDQWRTGLSRKSIAVTKSLAQLDLPRHSHATVDSDEAPHPTRGEFVREGSPRNSYREQHGTTEFFAGSPGSVFNSSFVPRTDNSRDPTEQHSQSQNHSQNAQLQALLREQNTTIQELRKQLTAEKASAVILYDNTRQHPNLHDEDREEDRVDVRTENVQTVASRPIPAPRSLGSFELIKGEKGHLNHPVNFPLSILQTYETHFPTDRVLLHLAGAYTAPGVTTLDLPKRPPDEKRVEFSVAYNGPVLASTSLNAILTFQAAHAIYVQQGGKDHMYMGITGSAATQLASDYADYSKLTDEGLVTLLYHHHGPKNTHELQSGFNYLANSIHGLSGIHLLAESDAHDALVAFALSAVRLVRNVQADFINRLSAKKVVEYFMQQIPTAACAHARSKILEYQETYLEAEIRGQYLHKYDTWNLLFTSTILIAYLKTFSEHIRKFARDATKSSNNPNGRIGNLNVSVRGNTPNDSQGLLQNVGSKIPDRYSFTKADSVVRKAGEAAYGMRPASEH